MLQLYEDDMKLIVVALQRLAISNGPTPALQRRAAHAESLAKAFEAERCKACDYRYGLASIDEGPDMNGVCRHCREAGIVPADGGVKTLSEAERDARLAAEALESQGVDLAIRAQRSSFAADEMRQRAADMRTLAASLFAGKKLAQ